jgi:oligogalacturonide lyase
MTINTLASACFATLVLFAGTSAEAQVGRRFPSEKQVIVDKVTKLPITFLTSGKSSDSKPYQTHPSWAADGVHIVFRSSTRSPDGPQAFAVNEKTGDIIQLTEGPGVGIGSLNLARKSNTLYYMRRSGLGPDGTTRLIKVDLTALISDAMHNRVKHEGYEQVVATLPAGHIEAGGFTLDADEKTAYVGFDARRAPPRPPGQPVPQVPGGIRAIDLATGAVRTVIETQFRMGHVQANPFVPGEILYCHETGGDAPQRMWVVKAYGTGNRPLFEEGPTDWVTHEQFADADHVIFNLMGHQRPLRKRPTGLFVVSLRDGTVDDLGQLPVKSATGPTGGFWHNAVTYNGRLAAADDFEGNVTLIDRRTNARTLLSTGHVMRPDHTHPSFSADNKRLLIQSGMLTDGKTLALAIIPVLGPFSE